MSLTTLSNTDSVQETHSVGKKGMDECYRYDPPSIYKIIHPMPPFLQGSFSINFRISTVGIRHVGLTKLTGKGFTASPSTSPECAIPDSFLNSLYRFPTVANLFTSVPLVSTRICCVQCSVLAHKGRGYATIDCNCCPGGPAGTRAGQEAYGLGNVFREDVDFESRALPIELF